MNSQNILAAELANYLINNSKGERLLERTVAIIVALEYESACIFFKIIMSEGKEEIKTKAYHSKIIDKWIKKNNKKITEDITNGNGVFARAI